MAAAYHALDRAFAVGLFEQCPAALVSKRSRREQTAILAGLLGQEAREWPWTFTGMPVPRLRRLVPFAFRPAGQFPAKKGPK
jgi:hypothetical protein